MVLARILSRSKVSHSQKKLVLVLPLLFRHKQIESKLGPPRFINEYDYIRISGELIGWILIRNKNPIN